MDCTKFRALLDREEGVTGSEQAKEWCAHKRSCPACAQYVRDLKQRVEALIQGIATTRQKKDLTEGLHCTQGRRFYTDFQRAIAAVDRCTPVTDAERAAIDQWFTHKEECLVCHQWKEELMGPYDDKAMQHFLNWLFVSGDYKRMLEQCDQENEERRTDEL